MNKVTEVSRNKEFLVFVTVRFCTYLNMLAEFSDQEVTALHEFESQTFYEY